MMESRRSYGWGMVGEPGEGFDYRLRKGRFAVIGGKCMKSELAASRAAHKFLKESKYWEGAEVEIIPYEVSFGY